jgi:hypothetical protein
VISDALPESFSLFFSSIFERTMALALALKLSLLVPELLQAHLIHLAQSNRFFLTRDSLQKR